MSELPRLTSVEQLDGWLERSRLEPVWIFKHSLTCGTSAAAIAEFEHFVGGMADERRRSAVVVVQTAREVSSELARRTGVRHESPQALLLRDGEAIWHASHWRIRADRLRAAAGEAVGTRPG
jgi:bacillithiol system protein YtxJ